MKAQGFGGREDAAKPLLNAGRRPVLSARLINSWRRSPGERIPRKIAGEGDSTLLE